MLKQKARARQLFEDKSSRSSLPTDGGGVATAVLAYSVCDAPADDAEVSSALPSARWQRSNEPEFRPVIRAAMALAFDPGAAFSSSTLLYAMLAPVSTVMLLAVG